jgi:hypothetical protein
VLGELAGHNLEKAMALGQPVIGAGDTKQARDGSVGLHVDEFPEAAALMRWRAHEFLEVERVAAKGWRAELARHEPAQLVDVLQNILPSDAKFSDLDQLKSFIDSFCSSSAPEVLALALDVLAAPTDYRQIALNRWLSEGQPPLDRFAPYATHVFKVDLLFYLGISRGFISGERASNTVDMAYLYYLPFASVFVSGDRLHHRTAPLFLRENQTYLSRDELKPALLELDDYYDALPEEIKQLGVLAIASFPPSDLDNAVTRQWDIHMRRDWRERAKAVEADLGKPRDLEADRRTVAELNEKLGEARPMVDENASLDEAGPDYVVISRQMPAEGPVADGVEGGRGSYAQGPA